MALLRVAPGLKAFGRRFSAKNLTKKAFLNAAAAILDYGARVLVAFLVTPILVSKLGDLAYGIWQISVRLTGYLSVAGGRPTQALKWTVASQQVSVDYDKKRREVGSAVAVSLLFLPILGALGAVLVWYSPILLDVSAELVWMVRAAVTLLVINLMVTDLADVPHAVLMGENLGYQRIGISSLLVLAGGLLTALVVYWGGGLVGAAAVALLMTLVTGAFYMLVVRRFVPWFGVAVPSWQDVRSFFSLSWWFIAWRLVQQGMMASDIVVLGLLNSAELVTVYTLTKFIPDALTNLTVATVVAVLPGLGGIVNSGKMEKAAQARGLIMSATWLLVTLAGGAALLWGREFISLWVGPEYDAGPVATLLVTLMVAQVTLIRNDANLINLTLDLPKKVMVGAVSVALSLGIAGVLIGVYDMGIVGLCVGFIAGRAILSVAYPWSLSRFLGVPFHTQLLGAVRPVAVTAVLFWALLYARGLVTVDTWLGLVVYGGLSLVLMAVVLFFAGLSRRQRSGIWARFQMIVR